MFSPSYPRFLRRAQLVGAASLLSLVSLVSCKKDVPTPDPSRIEAGTGWYCYHQPHGSDSTCFRTEADCKHLLGIQKKGEPSQYAPATCEPQSAAWCFVRAPEESVPWACKVDAPSCHDKADFWNSSLLGSGASSCFEVD